MDVQAFTANLIKIYLCVFPKDRDSKLFSQTTLLSELVSLQGPICCSQFKHKISGIRMNSYCHFYKP